MSAPASGRAAFVAGATDEGATVQSALRQRTGLSHAAVKGLVSAGMVRINGRPVTRPDRRLEPGDRVEASWEPGRRYREIPASRRRGPGFVIVYEDDDVVVVDKDAGTLTVPTPDHRGASVAEHLGEIYRRRGFKAAEASAVHRIDRYTSGLVAFARHGAARVALRREFAACRPERVYLAVVEGRPAADSGRLEHRLVEHEKSLKVAVARAPGEGRRASCRYRVVETFAHAALVEVRLETGRRNQIRVQFAAIGHPLVGDVAYGRPSPSIGRTALHAHRLSFRLPTGRDLSFESPIPRDIRKLLRALRRGDEPAGEPPAPEAPTRPPAGGRRYR